MVHNANYLLTRVEFSLVGSVWTKSLRMSPSSSDTGLSLTIKSSRLMCAVTFMDLVNPQLVRGDFSFALCLIIPYYTS